MHHAGRVEEIALDLDDTATACPEFDRHGIDAVLAQIGLKFDEVLHLPEEFDDFADPFEWKVLQLSLGGD